MEVFANVEHVLYSHGSQNNHLFVIICNYIQLDTSPFLVKDRDAEEQFKFDLQRQVFSKWLDSVFVL